MQARTQPTEDGASREQRIPAGNTSSELHQLGSLHPHTTPRDVKNSWCSLYITINQKKTKNPQKTKKTHPKTKVRMFGFLSQLSSLEYGLMIPMPGVTSHGRWLKSHSLSCCSSACDADTDTARSRAPLAIPGVPSDFHIPRFHDSWPAQAPWAQTHGIPVSPWLPREEEDRVVRKTTG